MLLFRTRLGAAIDAAESVKIFLQLQDSRTAGSEASVAANTGNVDMHQAYLDLPSSAASLGHCAPGASR